VWPTDSKERKAKSKQVSKGRHPAQAWPGVWEQHASTPVSSRLGAVLWPGRQCAGHAQQRPHAEWALGAALAALVGGLRGHGPCCGRASGSTGLPCRVHTLAARARHVGAWSLGERLTLVSCSSAEVAASCVSMCCVRALSDALRAHRRATQAEAACRG